MSEVEEFEFTRKPVYELHPAGEWKSEFIKWERDTHPEFGNQCKLTFQTEILGHDDEPRKLSTWCQPTLGTSGKIYQMLTGAWGINPDTDITDDELRSGKFLDKFIGKRLRLQIAHVPKKNKPTEISDKITGYLPYKAAEVKRAARFNDESEAPTPTAPPATSAKPDLSDGD